MLMEIMGLQLPGSSFVNPGTELRTLLNEEAVKVLVEMITENSFDRTISQIISEKTIVNGIVGLLATGGSTNHTIHLIAIAKAAGIIIDWTDFSELSKIAPLLTRVYPNGAADVNHFHASGGMGFVMRTLLENGLLHEDVNTILGTGLSKYKAEPKIKDHKINWVDGAKTSLNTAILRPVDNPFSPEGGITMLEGNIGRSVLKTSAVDPENYVTEAPAIVFNEQADLIAAFKKDELNKDFVAILPFQGPQQNGMPELHQLTPTLTILQKRGYRVALVTDGRMSGASGKVPSAIHVTPEARSGGAIGKIRTGDLVLVDAKNGILECKESAMLDRTIEIKDNSQEVGAGRELFNSLRKVISSSEEGASFIL
jgi:phosphogluconate dehydratase